MLRTPSHISTITDADGDSISVDRSVIDDSIWITVDEQGELSTVLLDADQVEQLISALRVAISDD